MRPIEFKAQNVNGVWVCGNLSILKKKIGNVAAGSYISNSAGAPFAYRVRPETVSQYSTLTDMYGTKLFEGHICWCEHDECYGKVVFAGGKFLFVFERISTDLWEICRDIVIAGDIFNDPKLLEGE
ncbi:YopX family protein [Listeria monocytogenes]